MRDKEFFRTNWAEAGFSSIGKAENAIALTRAAEAPVIDGRLEETAWLKAARLETFYQLKSSQSLNADPADPPTKVRILYDDKYIYFGLEATKAAGRTEDSAQENGLKALSGSHLEIFLMPPALRGKYYHLGLSHNGKVFSALTTDGKTRNLQDQMDFDYAIHDQPDRWFAELRIPVQKLGGIKEGISGSSISGARPLQRMARKLSSIIHGFPGSGLRFRQQRPSATQCRFRRLGRATGAKKQSGRALEVQDRESPPALEFSAGQPRRGRSMFGKPGFREFLPANFAWCLSISLPDPADPFP